MSFPSRVMEEIEFADMWSRQRNVVATQLSDGRAHCAAMFNWQWENSMQQNMQF